VGTTQQKSGNSNQVVGQSSKPGSKAAEGGGEQAGNEVAALQMMEGQLGRLSGIIKSHQEEIAQLRQALMASCAERQQLQQQLQQQAQMHQPVACGAASLSLLTAGVETVGGAGSSKGGGSSSGSSVVLKGPTAGAKGLVSAAPAVARSTSKSSRRQ
jgi:hypothetical protein